MGYQMRTWSHAISSHARVQTRSRRSPVETARSGGWQVRLCEAALYGDEYSEYDLADLIQSRWRELMEMGAV